MPVLDVDDFECRPWFRHAHINTVWPTLTRTVRGVAYTRSRMDTPDGDFIDLDWSKIGSRKLVIVLHGLEGNSERHYMQGAIKLYNHAGWDGVAINHRGCSGEVQKTSQIYHGGFTEDLRLVVDQCADYYDEIALVGFSLGGNIVLKYIGEQGVTAITQISSAVAVSVPIDLVNSAIELRKKTNYIYVQRFLKKLKAKLRNAEHLYRDRIDLAKVYAAKDFDEFDTNMTAPMLGFGSAREFYESASCAPYIEKIAVPTLLINAADDTFLGPKCYPRDVANKKPNFFLKIPKYGGHVGFKSRFREESLWSERTALAFSSTH